MAPALAVAKLPVKASGAKLQLQCTCQQPAQSARPASRAQAPPGHYPQIDLPLPCPPAGLASAPHQHLSTTSGAGALTWAAGAGPSPSSPVHLSTNQPISTQTNRSAHTIAHDGDGGPCCGRGGVPTPEIDRARSVRNPCKYQGRSGVRSPLGGAWPQAANRPLGARLRGGTRAPGSPGSWPAGRAGPWARPLCGPFSPRARPLRPVHLPSEVRTSVAIAHKNDSCVKAKP